MCSGFIQSLTSCGGPDRTHSGTPMSFRVKIIPEEEAAESVLHPVKRWIVTGTLLVFEPPDKPPTFCQFILVRKMLSR